MRMRFSPPWKKLAQPVGQERGTIVFWRMRLRNPAEQRLVLLLTLAATTDLGPGTAGIAGAPGIAGGGPECRNRPRENNPTDLLKALKYPYNQRRSGLALRPGGEGGGTFLRGARIPLLY